MLTSLQTNTGLYRVRRSDRPVKWVPGWLLFDEHNPLPRRAITTQYDIGYSVLVYEYDSDTVPRRAHVYNNDDYWYFAALYSKKAADQAREDTLTRRLHYDD